MTLRHAALALAAAALSAAGCSVADAPGRAPTPPAAPAAESASAPAADAKDAAARGREGADELRELMTALSEPDADFFSDNFVSNETSYLQVAARLARDASPGGAYIGVGPEQNFTYIALTRPSMAFIVDIRRENLLLHLLYKSIFEEATSRAHFLALLLGRPYAPDGDPGAAGGVEAVIAHAERLAPDEATFAASHARLVARLAEVHALPLDAPDRAALEVAHRAFFRGQLDLRFELREKNGRRYPPLRELLAAADPAGERLGFLATEAPFRLVQRMQREHRIVPLVGDFAGERALPGLAAYLTERRLEVSTFYVSNVEQYLLEPKAWRRWLRNVAALPTDDASLLVRCYLDQGRRHPQQLEGHRSATLVQRIADFEARRQGAAPTSFWAVSTEGAL